MAPPSQEDIEWFKSTFRPIPKPKLPDDCIEYSLYWIPATGDTDADSTRNALGEVQKSATGLVKRLLKDYIWQRDSFKLELTKEDGFNFLRGQTGYGDSIEDEWVIVYLLRELTKEYPELWVKVTDSDGEFLLVEAAATLPSWLEPQIAGYRVWIHKGQLIIIKPPPSADLKKKVSEKLTFDDARKIILDDPKRLMHSQSIEDEAFYRLRNYPQQIAGNLHASLVTIPRKVAHLLHLKPAYVSTAVEAFYLRDPISLRSLQSSDSSKLNFPPEDLVSVSVIFTKVGYAQLKSQDFDPPTQWNGKLPAAELSKEYARADMGMKLACGFEMLLSDKHNQDKPAVREMKLVLEDIETGDESLPADEEIKNNWSQREDSESWLNISMEDLEGELKGKKRGGEGAKLGDFGDKSAQENLQRIVAKFETFLNDDSAGFDGAELDKEYGSDSDVDEEDDGFSSEGEDHEVSFDDEQLSKMMQEMMGMPPGSGAMPPSESGAGRVQEMESDEGEEDDREKIEEVSRQMEAELKQSGILDQIKSSGSRSKGKDRVGAAADEAGHSGEEEENEEVDIDDEDIDINLAKNLLESLKSQGGAAGPGSNMLGLMGMKPPKYD